MGPRDICLAWSIMQLAHGATKTRLTYRTMPLKLLQLQFEAKNSGLMPRTNCMHQDFYRCLDQIWGQCAFSCQTGYVSQSPRIELLRQAAVVPDGCSVKATNEARTCSLHPIKKHPSHEPQQNLMILLHFVIRTTSSADVLGMPVLKIASKQYLIVWVPL